MPMHFEELDETTRRFMLAEFESEEASGKPYRARGLSPKGLSVFHDVMREAIQSGTEETLSAALANPAYWDRHEIYYRTGNPSTRRVNVHQAAERLGLTEFNTWYVRGLARRLLEDGEKECQVYRAAAPKGTPDTCPLQDGQIVPLQDVYRGHRASYWPEPGNPEALSVPSSPGCHHTIRRVRSS
jgi:hypothetical protein